MSDLKLPVDAVADENTAKTTDQDSEKAGHVDTGSDEGTEIDFQAYHEHNAGRLVIDPEYVTHRFTPIQMS